MNYDRENRVRELETAKHWAEAVLAQYTDLYEFDSVTFLTVDGFGVISEASASATGLLGTPADNLSGRLMEEYIVGESRQAFREFLRGVMKSDGTTTIDLEFRGDDGQPAAVTVEGKAANNGRECRLAVINLTKGKT